MMVGDDGPNSPKFISHITQNDSHLIEDEHLVNSKIKKHAKSISIDN